MVSVIIPIYNAAPYLTRCIDSVLTQTYTDVEILLVDDGSSDGCLEICRQYEAAYPQITAYHQANSGVSAARNLGLRQAKGDWICFVDGDDFTEHTLIEELLVQAEDGMDVICCAARIFCRGKFRDYPFFTEEFTAKSPEAKRRLFCQLMDAHYEQDGHLYVTAIGVPWGKLYRRSFLAEHELLFPEDMRRMQDNIFNMYAFYYAEGIRYCNRYLYDYRAEHIRSYDVAYPPEAYGLLLEKRDHFFEQDSFFSDAGMRAFRNGEKIEFLYASLKNILLTSHGYRRARPRMDELFCNPLYQGLLSESGEDRSRKQKMISFLYRHKWYRLMYYGMGLLWRCRNVYNRIRG